MVARGRMRKANAERKQEKARQLWGQRPVELRRFRTCKCCGAKLYKNYDSVLKIEYRNYKYKGKSLCVRCRTGPGKMYIDMELLLEALIDGEKGVKKKARKLLRGKEKQAS